MSCCVSKLDLCRLIQESYKSPTFNFGDTDVTNDTFVYKVKIAGESFTEYPCTVIAPNIVVINEYTLPVGNYIHEMLWTSANGTELIFQGALKITSVGSCCGSSRNNTIKVIQNETVVKINVSENNIIIGGGGSSEWGGITGDIENQTDLVDLIDSKIGNGTITITQGGVSKGTFTTNQSNNTTIEVDTGGSNPDVELVLKSFLEETPRFDLYLDMPYNTITTRPNINGVICQSNQLLRGDNTSITWSEAGLTMYTWRNIPTTYNGNKLTKIDIDFVRIAGLPVNLHANLLGVKPNGSIDVLMGSLTQNPSGIAEEFSFDITDYNYISIMVAKMPTYEESSFVLYTGGSSMEVEEDAVMKFILANSGESAKIESETLIFVDKPTSLPIVNIIGNLPTDITPSRTPTNIEFEYIINNKIVFKCKSTLAIQGNATAGAEFPKKGYETAFTNYEDEDLEVQIGKWIPCKEFHLKAFPNDPTMTRDVGASRLWKEIRTSRPFPSSYIADFNSGQITDDNVDNLYNQALFIADGFPIEMYHNGVFLGLYVFRLKKERDNYMINRDNPNHILLDNEKVINWTTFDYTNWKVRSPRLTGYVDGGVINDSVLMGKLNRWWTWFAGISNDSIDFESTVNDYLNVDSWVDWLITQQLTTHWDSQINNMLPISWDGNKLSLSWYDGDQTFGFVTTPLSGFDFPLVIDAEGLYWRGDFFRYTLYPKLLTRIQSRYTELRDLKIIDTKNIYNIINDIATFIPKSAYKKEFDKWNHTFGNTGKHNVRYITNWTNTRIGLLDDIWLNS